MIDYAAHALAQMPRLLSRMDREACSKTYGGFDRTFWGWKFTDFAGSRFQESLYAMTWFYTTPKNIYYQNDRILEWIKAGFQYWQTLQHNDGSFDEAYPFERSLAATSFTSFYLGEAFLRLKEKPAALIETFRKAGDWLCKNDEHHGVLSNHLAVAAAALEIISRITGESKYAERGRYFIDRILSRQSNEGWYEEYGGADFGYQTHGTFYLARYWELTRDENLLESLKRSAKFIAYFIHPNGTLGGEYGSRNTSFYFPAGFEILAGVCETSAAIAKFMRASVTAQAAAGLSMMDAYNFCPLLNNYLFAQDAAKDLADAPLPFMGTFHREFPEAGLLVHTTEKYQAVFAPSKGGVLKIYDKAAAKLAFSDCGYWARLTKGGSISSQSFSTANNARYANTSAAVTTSFAKINQRVMNPILFIGFRGFMITIGRQKQLALLIKNILVKALVSRRKTINAILERGVTFDEDTVTIEDRLSIGPDVGIGPLHLDAKFSTIHMGSARYYQSEELEIPPLIQPEGLTRKFIWKSQ